MQTGIPVIATFHASTSTKFIQRMTGQPVNIPLSFIDNVNVIIFQSAVSVNGRFLRRVTHVEEFVGFNREAGGIMTRVVFKWDPNKDRHNFRGMNNSHILENKIAAGARLLGQEGHLQGPEEEGTHHPEDGGPEHRGLQGSGQGVQRLLREGPGLAALRVLRCEDEVRTGSADHGHAPEEVPDASGADHRHVRHRVARR